MAHETPNGLRAGDIVLHTFVTFKTVGVVYGWNGGDAIDVYFKNVTRDSTYQVWPGHWYWSSCEKLGSIFDFENFVWD